MAEGINPWQQPQLRLSVPTSASPFELIKNAAGAAERGAALGLSPIRFLDCYTINQSFPRTSQQTMRKSDSPALQRCRSHEQLGNISLLAQGGRGARLIQNPNKAWAIVSSESGKVLVSNSLFTTLTVHSDQRDTRIWDLLEQREAEKTQVTLEQLEVDPSTGESLLHSGQVHNIVTATGDKVAVSVTVHPLSSSQRQMVLLEPVHKTVGQIDIDHEGLITGMDETAELIFQLKDRDHMGEPISRLIPLLEMPGEEAGSRKKMATTGRTDDDLYFPISVMVARDELGSAVDYDCYEAGCRVTVWVFSSLSGLVLLNQNGDIIQCDQSLSGLVLGYLPGELHHKRIEDLIPGFYDEFDVPSCDRTEEDLGCEELSPSSSFCEDPQERPLPLEDTSPLEEISLNVRACQISSPKQSPLPSKAHSLEKENLEESPVFKRPSAVCLKTPVKIPMEVLTSTPAPATTPSHSARRSKLRQEGSAERIKFSERKGSSQEKLRSFDELSATMPTGCFYGLARHSSGADISILYNVKRIVLRSGEVRYCVWITRDCEDTAGKTQAHLTLATTLGDSAVDPAPLHKHAGLADQGEAALGISFTELVDGSYSDHYVTLDQIGKGAYGCVRGAYRLVDRALVVVKFIFKHKVSPESWVEESSGGRIPLEVSILRNLNHPAIVSVIDVFQNSRFVQMVMAKHGDMDLFEFIDRNPSMDEALSSYIFRQVVAGVGYLHANHILHRDIKDENVIIDNRFQIRLIDFGSAAFFHPDQTFYTFFGTLEYCAPEVLKGDPYHGPEVEMWSLGVLLYIIMFGENPFYDALDTVRGELHPPHLELSAQCWSLIESILEPLPEKRASLWYIQEHEWVVQPCSIQDYRFQEAVPCTQAEISSQAFYTEPLLPPPPVYSGQPSLSSADHPEDPADHSKSLGMSEFSSLECSSLPSFEYSAHQSADRSVQSVSELNLTNLSLEG